MLMTLKHFIAAHPHICNETSGQSNK